MWLKAIQPHELTGMAAQSRGDMRILEQLVEQKADCKALREDLQARELLLLEVQQKVSTQLEEQAATIEELHEELTQLRKLKSSF